MRSILYISLLVLHLTAFSQNETLSEPYAGFSAVIVQDLNRSIEWYSGILGFEVIDQAENPDRGFAQANLKNGYVMLELIELETAVSPAELLKGYDNKTKITGFFKFGMTVSDFDSWVRHLEKENAHISGSVVANPATGKKMIIVLDPDGNRIQLFEN